jgi:hypothetical protein
MKSPRAQQIVIVAVSPPRRPVETETVDRPMLREDAVEHGVDSAIFALVVVKEALRRPPARDVAQVVGAIEHVKTHRVDAEQGIDATEQRIAQGRE